VLVESIMGRSSEAFAEVYGRYAHAVFDFARCMVGDRAVAEDVVQDVFVRFWNGPERYDAQRGPLRGYLLTLARGCSIDIVRSETARRRREERDLRLRGSGAVESNREDALANNDALHTALGQLRATEREALALAYFGGYSYRDVATQLDVPEGTIKNRIRAGLAHLRDGLAGEEVRRDDPA
jgi:RNA polymerase sigma-70 factor (ECF subfamily)